MKLHGIRRVAILATAIGLLAASLSVGSVLASGGLSVTPGILEHVARPGGIGTVRVANTTGGTMTVRLAVRPWVQARSGAVAPNRRRTLGKVRPNRSTFALRAGASRTLRLSLARRPAGGSTYGAIEATGTPRRGGKNVRVAYRLVTSLRLFPPDGARRYRTRTSAPFEHGTVRHGALFIAVKNAGNTIDPIGGRLLIKGHGHTLNGIVTPKTILPGATVNLRLTRLRGTLPRGRYAIAVSLTQAGHRVGGALQKNPLALRHGRRVGVLRRVDPLSVPGYVRRPQLFV